MRRVTPGIASMVLLLSPSALWAQEGLSQLLLRFFSPANPIKLKFTGHQAHFSSQTEATSTLDLLNKNIAYQLASFPLGSSSGGFTFTLDPSVGVLTRSAESFGPLFAERAVNAGKGKLTLGGSYLHSTFDKFEGNDLKNGDITLTLTHVDLDNSGDNLTPFFEGDVIDAKLFLTLKTDTFVFFANYGVTNRLDVGVAVPVVRVEVDARVHATIKRDSTGRETFVFHEFEEGGLEHDFFESGNKTGIGDIVVRGKLGLARGENVNLAAGIDVRLPTGKEEDLLGSGAVQAKVFLIASGGAKKRFTPHINAGYTYTGKSDFLGELPNEINYSAGFDAAPASRLTIMADFVGRTLLDANRLVTTQKVFPYRLSTDPLPPFSRTDRVRPFLVTESGKNLNLFLGSAGIKFNPGGRLLLSANVLFSLSQNNGLQDKVTPVFSVDYNF